jgi:hypothetical protein
MMKLTTKIAGVALTAAMLVTAVPAQASVSVDILNACLAQAEKASDPKAARNHCIWRHWEYMASYG